MPLQKGRLLVILMKQEMTEWRWYQLDHMQITCTALQKDNDIITQSFIGQILLLTAADHRHTSTKVRSPVVNEEK